MALAMLLLTIGDAMTKWVGGRLPVGQIIFFRRCSSSYRRFSLFLLPAGWRRSRSWTGAAWGLRALFYLSATAAIATSMVLLPLADAVALLFAGPLFVTALAIPMLGEHIGWRRWAAVLTGFAGVLIMLRPTPDAIHLLAIVPIFAALLSALRDVTTRGISATESSNAIMFWSNVALVIVSAGSAPFGWGTDDRN